MEMKKEQNSMPFSHEKFDEWLSQELKASAVKAPDSLSENIINQLDIIEPKAHIDPALVIATLLFATVGILIVVIPQFMPQYLLEQIESIFNISLNSLPKSLTFINTGLAMGLVFIGFDYLLNRIFLKKRKVLN